MAKPRAKVRKSKLRKPKGKPGRKPLQEKDPLTDPKWLTSVNVIALAYNDSTRWIQKLSKLKDGLPKEIKGKYHLVKVLRWTVEYYKSKVAELEAGGSRQEQQMRLRILTAKAKRQELETAQALAEVITIEDVIKEIAEILYDTQTIINGQGDRMAPILAHRDAKEVKKLLDDDNAQRLDDLSAIPDRAKRLAKVQAKNVRGVEDVEEPAENDGEPVGGHVQTDSKGHGRGVRKVAHGARGVSKGHHGRRHRPADRKSHHHGKRAVGKN